MTCMSVIRVLNVRIVGKVVKWPHSWLVKAY
jgi:hypothetical protein